MVSEEELSKLEDELLIVFSKAGIGSRAYSNHVTNPSTSSLPAPRHFRTSLCFTSFLQRLELFQNPLVRIRGRHQQHQAERSPVFPDLFLQLLVLQGLHIRQVALLYHLLATARLCFQFF